MALTNPLQRLRGSLTVQTSIFMLLCLLAAQWVSVWAFCDERAAMLRDVARDQAAREMTLVALAGASDPAGLSREDLTFWVTDAQPNHLPAYIAAQLPASQSFMAAQADVGVTPQLDWNSSPNGLAVANVGHVAAVLSAPLASGGWLNAALVMPSWTDPWAMQNWSALLLTSIALLLSAAAISRRITAPMRALADAADRFGGGATVPVPTNGPTEMARTFTAFNAMQDRITALVSDRTRMLSALGHDLRTPMTRLRLRAHLIDDSDLRDPVLRDLDEMEELSDRALDLARGNSEPKRPTDVSDLLRELVEDLREAGIDADTAALAPVPWSVQTGALRRAVANLLENAHRYAGGGTVSLQVEKGTLTISVIDSGPGLPKDSFESVKQPFVRLERSRARHTGGCGLGLALAAATAREHGGTLKLSNRSSGGLLAVIELPGSSSHG